MKPWHRVAATAFAALSLAWTSAAPAQLLAHPALLDPAPLTYSDAELKSFAAAAANVEQIKASYRPRLQAARTEEEKYRLHTEAADRMAKAIAKQGISMNKYSEIAAQAERRPEIRQRIERHIEHAMVK